MKSGWRHHPRGKGGEKRRQKKLSSSKKGFVGKAGKTDEKSPGTVFRLGKKETMGETLGM